MFIFSFVLCEVNPSTENTVSDRQEKNILDLEIVDWSHDPTRCPKDKAFVWCLESDYNREKHPYSCNFSLDFIEMDLTYCSCSFAYWEQISTPCI